MIKNCLRLFASLAIKEEITGRSAYFDFQATTPLDPRVLDEMMPYLTNEFGNPHSRTHAYGWKTESAVEKARKQVADILKADTKEIIFTSGATESNNCAIKGVAKFNLQRGKNKIITVQTEHKCVLDSCRHLQEEGFDVVYLPVDKYGLLDLELLDKTIDEKTSLVSVMAANNEIGTIQPIKDIGSICKKHKVFFHTDAAQAVGKIDIDVNDMNIDLLSLSSHKIYGPKGIGALYVRRKPRVRLFPIINGGGQERGLRSGTLAPALVVGLGSACEIAAEEMPYESRYIEKLAKKFKKAVMENVSEVILNGHPEKRLPGNLNMSFSYVEGESLIMALKHLALSSGSACTSASLEPSYVLRAIGVQEDLAHTSLRIGIGRFTTEEEIDYAISLVEKHVAKLRNLSPLWEMVQEGVDLKNIQWTQPH
jgi:cysteine desulfurase